MPPSKDTTYDTLVVGGGLAGQLLARALARFGQRVCLAYDPAQRGASRVAAWMINPVTGIRFVPSWRIENYLPAAIRLYHELEAESGLKIWHPLPILRLFQGADERPRWDKKRLQPEVRRYITAEHPAGEHPQHPPDLGGVTFHSGGWADLGLWLQHHLAHPTAGIEVVEGNVQRSELQGTSLTWQGRTFTRVVFCTGYQPSALPWKPAKGELLTVRITGLQLSHILLRGIFV
ncbi:MAG TPA: FAD-dependent oxidoreductase, partial [Chthoniobacterales bacterium]